MRSRSISRVALGLAVALVAAACAAHPPAAPATSAPAKGALPETVTALLRANLTRTRAETVRLLSLARLPAARTPLRQVPAALSGPAMGTPATSSLIDARRLWTVAMPFPQAVAWVRAHPPAGLTAQGTSSSGDQGVTTSSGYSYGDRDSRFWTGAELDVSVVPAGSGASDWRVDGLAQWLDPIPEPDSAPGPRRHVTTAAGCPATLRGVVGVTNSAADLRASLVPAGTPTAARLCRYTGFPSRRTAERIVAASDARELARLARLVRLSHTDGVTSSCPGGPVATSLVAFGYRDGTSVDLWSTGGCTTVANGLIVAGGPGGGNVEPLVSAVARLLR